MPVGFQSINSANGSYQIDGNYLNPSLLRKGNVASVYDSTYKRGTASIAVAPNELIAVATSVGYCAIVTRNASFVEVHTDLAVSGTIINYWIFGFQSGAANNFGMQVFNPAGQLIFDALHKHLSVVQKLSGGGGSGVSVTLPTGRVYAVMVQQVNIFYSRGKTDIDFGTVNMYFDCSRIAGNIVYVQQKQVMAYDGMVNPNPGWEGSWGNDVTSQHIIIDVTNF